VNTLYIFSGSISFVKKVRSNIKKGIGINNISSSFHMTDIFYCKSKNIDLEHLEKQYREDTQETHNYNPFRIKYLQNYNPIYGLFFEMNDNNYNSISLNHPNHFVDLHTVVEEHTKQQKKTPIHIKYAPLLDPIHYLIGKYEKERNFLQNLPIYSSCVEKKRISKIVNQSNSAYIDCFFSYLSSQLYHRNKFIHSVDFYGSYLGIQEKFRFDISDDYEYLLDSEFFFEKKNDLYELESNCFLPSSNSDLSPRGGERGNSLSLKPKLSLGEIYSDLSPIDADILDLDLDLNLNLDENMETKIETEAIESALELVYEKEPRGEGNEEEEEYDDSEENSIENNSFDDLPNANSSETEDANEGSNKGSEEWSDMEEDDSQEEEPLIHVYIRDFPIQMICLEKGEGTFDALLEKDILGDAPLASALFQIIMSLAAFQKAYDFTHNDLHTNNIIYISTEYTHLSYTFLGKTYKVPTYGRIYKIIDFGRSIYRFQDKVLGSDSFAPGGDAHGQYNCEPFFNAQKPEIKPNPSFDLCRLGCSMYDFVFDGLEEEEIRRSRKKWTEVQKTIARWCMDDNGKNILYKSSGEERYPNFKLYKMIARMVHAHTPENQMGFSLFSQYDVSKINSNNDKKKKKGQNPRSNELIYWVDIDAIPKCYI